MTLYGPVHTNKNLYSVAGSGGSLNYDGPVSYHGDTTSLNPASSHPANFYEDPRDYVEGITQTLYNQESGNWNSYKNLTYTTSMNSQLSNVQSLDPLGMSTTAAVDPTNGNASGTHEIIERPVPVSASNPNANTAYADPDAFAAHRIFNSAGLRVIINRNATGQKVRVYSRNGANYENSDEIVPTGSSVPANQNIADQVIAAITPDATGSIYDFREGRTINADTVDMSKLTPALNAYSNYNGVLYINDSTYTDSSGNRADEAGSLTLIPPDMHNSLVRLEKSSLTPDTAFTEKGLDTYRRHAQAGAPQGATGWQCVQEHDNPLPIFGWKDHEFIFTYEFFGQAYKRNVLFVNLNAREQITLTCVAPADHFDRVRDAGFDLLRS